MHDAYESSEPSTSFALIKPVIETAGSSGRFGAMPLKKDTKYFLRPSRQQKNYSYFTAKLGMNPNCYQNLQIEQQKRPQQRICKYNSQQRGRRKQLNFNCHSWPSLWYSRTVISGFTRLYGQLRSPLLFSFLTVLVVAKPLNADGRQNELDDTLHPAAISTLGNDGAMESRDRLAKYQYSTAEREPIPFEKWLNQTQKNNKIFLNHSSYSEGEVLLFRTKKSRHRAIAVMSVATSPFASKFSDALTFKEWLKSVYSQNKALKLSVRTTEVVRPVLQHLYASKGNFRAPIIIHANTFANSGRNLGSVGQIEKPVDAVVFINAVAEYLPEAVISLGWTQSADYAAINRFDWRQTFRLIDYIHHLHQPVILNMKLNDAVHSLKQLEWLLGIESLSIYIIISGEVSDFVEDDASLSRLAALSSSTNKIFFDVDETWRRQLERNAPIQQQLRRKEKRSVEIEKWTNLVFANSHEVLSTSLVSSQGVAFLGWPNSLLISNRPVLDYPAKQRIAGRVMFMSKREARFVMVPRDSGMVVQLFEGPMELVDSTNPKIRDAIKIFIGYEGRVTIENTNRPYDGGSKYNYRKKRTRNGLSADSDFNLDKAQYYYYSDYHKSSIGQLPKQPCYDFEIVDRNWRVELNIRSSNCNLDKAENDDPQTANGNHQLYLQLDTPVTRSHKTRRVAISKSGDGAIDFIFHEINHNSGNGKTMTFAFMVAICTTFQLIRQIIFVY